MNPLDLTNGFGGPKTTSFFFSFPLVVILYAVKVAVKIMPGITMVGTTPPALYIQDSRHKVSRHPRFLDPLFDNRRQTLSTSVVTGHPD
jgi:hypothetical protein